MLSDVERVMLMRADEQMLTAKWAGDQNDNFGHPYPGAAERAARVRGLYEAGWTDAAIARELGVVRQCVTNIRARLGLPSRHSSVAKKRGAR